MSGRDADIAILGGGLSGGLTALALAALRPDVRVLVIEAGAACGGNHVWSFFDSDVEESARWLVDPLVVRRWDEHEVRFPGGTRRLPVGYNAITGERLDAVLEETLPPGSVMRASPVVEVGAYHVVLEGGRRIEAGAVVDARGARAFAGLTGGWQSFVGQLIRTGPHGLERPVIMDATVAQHEGYRFVYVLPFSPDTLLVEDTYYAARPVVERDVMAGRIADYLGALGLRAEAVLKEEQGVLPVVAGGEAAVFARAGHVAGVARIGARAGLFHPLTSYSLPCAVETALAIARLPAFIPAGLEGLCGARAAAQWRAGGYFRLLARMLFGAGEPGRQWRIFERFYRQDEGLIARFYAGRMTAWDRIRLLIGRPPVPVGRALAALLGRGAPLARLDGADPLRPPPVSDSMTIPAAAPLAASGVTTA